MYLSGTHKSSATRGRLLVAGGGVMLTVLLALLPPQIADIVRVPVTTALLPAQHGLAATRRAARQKLTHVRAYFADEQATANRELQYNQLLAENQQLKAELRTSRDQVSLLAQQDTDWSPLLAAGCVPARVLGQPAQAYLARHRLIDAGQSQGVQDDALVLRPVSPLVDRGTSAGVTDGNVVLAGSCVWGKVAAAGLHTSVVCPITEPGYRDLVRLAAAAPDGHTLRFGAKGILEGTGEPLARLRMVEITEPVAEGDLVYSMAGQGFVDVPLLCGRVVRVERPQGAGHWEIWVAPSVDEEPDRLAILCPRANAIELAHRPTTPQSE